jgi:cell wall-associated NlpC family hydrolase
MAVLTAIEIYNVALAAGFTPDQAVTWTAMALAESNGVTDLADDERSGLWQIDAKSASEFGNLDDPLVNARAAFALSNRGTDLSLWGDGRSGAAQDYRMFIPAVTTIVSQHGPAGANIDATGYDQIDTGTDLLHVGTSAVDTDLDGLTDEYELLAGTDSTLADTDHDGLTDAFELITSHTDPLLADTDSDQVSDALEYATGTPAGTSTTGGATSTVTAGGVRLDAPDSDRDGLSNSFEQQAGLNAEAADTDADGMSDSLELSLGTDAKQVDTDHDGLSDYGEIQAGLNALVSNAPPAIPPAPPATPAAPAEPVNTGAEAKVQQMLDDANAQVGDQYVWGVDTDPDDPNPTQFDCAEFTQWAAHQVGIDLGGRTVDVFLWL